MYKTVCKVSAKRLRSMRLLRVTVSALSNAAIICACLVPITFAAAPHDAANKNTHSGTDISYIVQQSARVTEADRKASRGFDYSETDLESDGSHKTYSVRMLYGSPYRGLIAINGKPLPPEQQQEEHRKLQEETARRQHESPGDREHRIAEFEKEQTRDRRFMEEFVHAFNFKLLGEQHVEGRDVYVVQATPRADYHATDRDSRVLTGMRGQLWIDEQTYQWVKAQAKVVHPVSIAGFVATVEPGTRFILDKMPVTANVWLASHFSMTEKAEIFSFISHHKHEDITYFDYHKAADYSEFSQKRDWLSCPIRSSRYPTKLDPTKSDTMPAREIFCLPSEVPD